MSDDQAKSSMCGFLEAHLYKVSVVWPVEAFRHDDELIIKSVVL